MSERIISPRPRNQHARTNDPWLDAVARTTAVEIVDRYIHDRQALIRAIARLARAGLDGHVRIYAGQLVTPLRQ